MAWAEKLPSGRYRGVYRDAAGARRSAGTFPHKAKATREAAAQESKVRKRAQRDPEAYKQPWSEWCEDWWPTRGVEASTAKADAVRRDLHLMPKWGATAIGSITRQDIKAWVAELTRAGVTPSTRQRIVHLLSASLSAAVDAEVIEFNPASGLKLAKGAQAQERYLTTEEYHAIREELPTTFDQLVTDLLVNTGLRWSELAGMHWSRVDLGRGVLMVAETFSESAGAVKAYPKGRRVRSVPLVPELVDALAERLAEVGDPGKCGVEHVAGRCRSGLVLTTERGTPLRNSNWSPVWRDAAARAGIEARPYDLRHTYASWLLQAGVPLAEVGQLLGHVSMQTTMIYAHLEREPSRAVLKALVGRSAPRKLAEL